MSEPDTSEQLVEWEKLGELETYQQTDEASITCGVCSNDSFFILLPLAIECTNCGWVTTKKEEE